MPNMLEETDWNSRVPSQILAEYLEISGRHLSVQLVPGDVSEAQKEKAQIDLDHYFGELDIPYTGKIAANLPQN